MITHEWLDLDDAPQDSRWIVGQLADGSQVRMHYASDLSGSEQPPFAGFFKAVVDRDGRIVRFDEVNPRRWRPLDEREQAQCSQCAAVVEHYCTTHPFAAITYEERH